MPHSIFPGPLSQVASLEREIEEGAHGLKQVRQFVSPELCLCVCCPCLDLCHLNGYPIGFLLPVHAWLPYPSTKGGQKIGLV